MLQKIIASGILCMILSTSTAQTPTSEKPAPKILVSGYADVYYRYNFDNAASTVNKNNYTSFTNSQNSFELGMASVKLEHNTGKIGLVADLGFGKRAEEFSYNDANTRAAIKQLFISYSITDKLKLTAGTWATHVGYEMVDPYLNRNYSMSYMFSYGPFSHTGIKAEYLVGKHSFMLGLANPTDYHSANFSAKYLIGQYAVSLMDDKLKFYINYQGGKPHDSAIVNQIDFVASATLSSKFTLGFNATQSMYQVSTLARKGPNNDWRGEAIYLNYDPTPTLGLSLRSEVFIDKKVLTPLFASVPSGGGNIFANTLSANIKIDKSLTIIPELRYERGSEAIFVGKDGNSIKNTASFLVAAIYRF
jgi:hypothetical protein